MILALIGEPTFKRVLSMAFVLLFILSYVIQASTAKIAVLYALLLPVVAFFGVPLKGRIGAALAISIVQLAIAVEIVTPAANPMPAMAFDILTNG